MSELKKTHPLPPLFEGKRGGVKETRNLKLEIRNT